MEIYVLAGENRASGRAAGSATRRFDELARSLQHDAR